MKIPADENIYLSAAEAAAELAVSAATLYAYVSRGLVRSEPGDGPRSRRYRADDVRALKNRRAPRAEARTLRAFDNDLPALDSAVSTITELGPIYRGVACTGLAESATLEQAATLLWDVQGRNPFARENLPVLSDAMQQVVAATRRSAPIARTVALLALAAEADPRAFNRSDEGRAEIGARIMRLVVAGMTGGKPAARPLHEQLTRAWAPRHPHGADLLRRALVLLADHELNASTFTVRCAASTDLNLYDAVAAGLLALKGPRHGGAGPLAARMVAELANADMAQFVRDRVALGEPIPGFGHGVYRDGDPRALALLQALVKAGAERRLAVDAAALITEATGLRPNIDFALAVLMRTLGLPVGHEICLFAMARTAGWIAHAIEQLQTGNLIRPRARYTGPPPGRTAKRQAGARAAVPQRSR